MPLRRGVGQLVHHRVAGQRGVVRLDVQLEVVGQAVGRAGRRRTAAQSKSYWCVGRLLRLRLDQELAGEADLLLVVDGQVEELGQVVQLALQVGVVEVGVAFAAAPEDVVHAAEFAASPPWPS